MYDLHVHGCNLTHVRKQSKQATANYKTCSSPAWQRNWFTHRTALDPTNVMIANKKTTDMANTAKQTTHRASAAKQTTDRANAAQQIAGRANAS
jgi:hypothetical protein